MMPLKACLRTWTDKLNLQWRKINTWKNGVHINSDNYIEHLTFKLKIISMIKEWLISEEHYLNKSQIKLMIFIITWILPNLHLNLMVQIRMPFKSPIKLNSKKLITMSILDTGVVDALLVIV